MFICFSNRASSYVGLRGYVRTEDFVEEAEVMDAYAGPYRNYAFSVDNLELMPEQTMDLDEYDGAEIIWY